MRWDLGHDSDLELAIRVRLEIERFEQVRRQLVRDHVRVVEQLQPGPDRMDQDLVANTKQLDLVRLEVDQNVRVLASDDPARPDTRAACDCGLVAHAGQVVQRVLVPIVRVADRDPRLEVVGLPSERRIAAPVGKADPSHADVSRSAASRSRAVVAWVAADWPDPAMNGELDELTQRSCLNSCNQAP